MLDLDCSALAPNGDLALTVPHALSAEQRALLMEAVARALPGRKVLILDAGMRIGRVDDCERLDRIESKLDTLIAALAADDEDEPQYSLDGDRIPAERAEGALL